MLAGLGVGVRVVGWGQNEQQNKYFNEKYDFMHSSNLNYLAKYMEIQ